VASRSVATHSHPFCPSYLLKLMESTINLFPPARLVVPARGDTPPHYPARLYRRAGRPPPARLLSRSRSLLAWRFHYQQQSIVAP
jgi:hypothetical protein